jgi:hypothetical protein
MMMDKKTNKLLKEKIKSLEDFPYGYTIGVDSGSGKNDAAYCLVRGRGTEITVLLAKGNMNDEQFNEEVRNLAKYFNAKIEK